MDNLPSLSETVRIHNLRADKGLGQHFLLDSNITDRIARLCDLPATVLEVGPGPGGLTRSLFSQGAERVVAIEMDERFLPALDDIRSACGDLEVINGDALKVQTDLPEGHVIAANLPYNVGTKLLTNWLTQSPRGWAQMVLMFQLEVAERVVAAPGESAYGRLAVLAQSVCETQIAIKIPASAFSPPPKVDSAVVVLWPLETPYPHLKALSRVTQAAFGQRRKMLRRALKSLAKQEGLSAEDWLGSAGIDPTARAETVDVAGFQRLTDALINSRPLAL